MKSAEVRERQLLSVICKQAITKLLLAYSFQKVFFISKDLKHVHVTYSFDELFIFFRSIMLNVFCLKFNFPVHQKNTVRKYILGVGKK